MSAPIWDEHWRRQHVWPRFSRALGRDEIYLANHSLGRPPDRAAVDVQRALDAWYRDMDGAWDLWLATREQWRALTAKLVGAPRPDCIVPKTSAGQGLRAVLNSFTTRPHVLTTNAEFDSLDFILRVYREKGRIDLKVLRTLDPGCFAKKDPFAYQPPDPPQFAAGGDGWLESTPPIVTPFQALAGLEITLELGVERL